MWLMRFKCFPVCQGEGVAYRGRVLLELTTKLTDKPEQRYDDIHSDELLVVEVTKVEREPKHSTKAIVCPSFIMFLSWPAEVSQEEEVFPVCGLLFGHAAAGRGRCHPVWGQHRQLWQQVWLHLPPFDLHHPVQQSSVWWWVFNADN